MANVVVFHPSARQKSFKRNSTLYYSTENVHAASRAFHIQRVLIPSNFVSAAGLRRKAKVEISHFTFNWLCTCN